MAKLGRFSAIHQPTQKIVRRRAYTPVIVISNFNDGLYLFNSFTFTTANTVGRFGPNLSTLTTWYTTNYTGNTWISNTSNFNQTVHGYQLWTVPATGTYEITVAGARAGGRPGVGANIAAGYGQGAVIRSSNISLTQGEQLQIVVGQEGLSYSTAGSGGGGGGTFVVRYLANLAATVAANIVMVAGGGGSQNQLSGNAAVFAANYFTGNSNASLTSSAGNRGTPSTLGGSTAAGGTNGGAGATGAWGSGGAGFLANSTAGPFAGSQGIAYRFGANGGAANYTNISTLGGASVGGFGGGGGTHGFTGGGGGGGGYSGGGGGYQSNLWDMAGGGGSYSMMPGYTQVGYNRGPGYVVITRIS